MQTQPRRPSGPPSSNASPNAKDKKRTLIRSPRYFNLPDAEREQAVRLLAYYRKHQKDLPDKADAFAVEDVCGRVSGIGSMGRYRYVLLLAGKGSAEARNLLLEFKEARPSAYDLYRDRDNDEAALAHRAEHVIAMQRLSQAASNRYLGWARDGGLSFQVRQLGPHDARLDTKPIRPADLDDLGRIQMGILARVHARSAGRGVGPSNPLAELADPEAFCQRVLSLVLGYADVVRADYKRFVGAGRPGPGGRVDGVGRPSRPQQPRDQLLLLDRRVRPDELVRCACGFVDGLRPLADAGPPVVVQVRLARRGEAASAPRPPYLTAPGSIISSSAAVDALEEEVIHVRRECASPTSPAIARASIVHGPALPRPRR